MWDGGYTTVEKRSQMIGNILDDGDYTAETSRADESLFETPELHRTPVVRD
jgi:hypothetical protein